MTSPPDPRVEARRLLERLRERAEHYDRIGTADIRDVGSRFTADVLREAERLLRALLAEGEPMEGWQSPAAAPEGQWMLIAWKRFESYTVARKFDGQWRDEEEAIYAEPDGAMPLPSLPQGR